MAVTQRYYPTIHNTIANKVKQPQQRPASPSVGDALMAEPLSAPVAEVQAATGQELQPGTLSHIPSLQPGGAGLWGHKLTREL